MKRAKWILAALTAGTILSAGSGQALAYFTTYTEARGGYPVFLGDQTEITEEFSDWTKFVTIHNEADSKEPVWIRVKAYSTYDLIFEGADWSAGDEGYYYYARPVEAGQDTGVLSVKIGRLDASGTLQDPAKPGQGGAQDPDNPQEAPEGNLKESFNVIVIYESTPVRYGADGSLLPADWNQILDTGTMEGEGTE